MTLEQMRKLAEVERRMDSGEQPFVEIHGYGRLAVPQHILDECGIVSGQTISSPMLRFLLKRVVVDLQVKTAIYKAQKGLIDGND